MLVFERPVVLVRVLRIALEGNRVNIALAMAIVSTLTGALAIFAAWAKVTKTKRDDRAASWLYRQVTRVYFYAGMIRTWYREWKRKQ